MNCREGLYFILFSPSVIFFAALDIHLTCMNFKYHRVYRRGYLLPMDIGSLEPILSKPTWKIKIWPSTGKKKDCFEVGNWWSWCVRLRGPGPSLTDHPSCTSSMWSLTKLLALSDIASEQKGAIILKEMRITSTHDQGAWYVDASSHDSEVWVFWCNLNGRKSNPHLSCYKKTITKWKIYYLLFQPPSKPTSSSIFSNAKITDTITVLYSEPVIVLSRVKTRWRNNLSLLAFTPK